MLPVSVGEAIDKLSILDIKLDKIKDVERNKHCKIEYDMLYEKLKDCITENKLYYNQLKEINEKIWDLQDNVRCSDSPIGELCIDILNMNDSRFRIKDIINRKANSLLREQKGYSVKRALFLGHQGLGDHIMYIGAIRYLSLLYDEFVVACVHSHNFENVKSFYVDNPSIKVIGMNRDYSYRDQIGLEKEMKISQYDKVYTVGIYKEGGFPPEEIPTSWYTQLGLDTSIRKKYFAVPSTSESLSLYNSLKTITYIFVQQKSSDTLTKLVDWDMNDILTIDPNINMYPSGHTWHDLAQTFINKPFFYYYDTITHASELHMVDSSFFCIAIHLPFNAKIANCYNRDGTLNEKYTQLFSE
jgi:hypothetical protein